MVPEQSNHFKDCRRFLVIIKMVTSKVLKIATLSLKIAIPYPLPPSLTMEVENIPLPFVHVHHSQSLLWLNNGSHHQFCP